MTEETPQRGLWNYFGVNDSHGAIEAMEGEERKGRKNPLDDAVDEFK